MMDAASIAMVVVGFLNLIGVVVTARYARRTDDAVNHKRPSEPTLREVTVMVHEQVKEHAAHFGRFEANLGEVMRRMERIEDRFDFFERGH